jgi:hypothetical protein
MLRSSRTGPTKIGSLTRASVVLVGALVALFGVIAGPLLGVFATPASAATGSGYTAITPYRALGTAAAGAPVVAGTPATVQITSSTAGEVPAGATAAVLNVTASNPTSAGYLEVYPGTTAPATATSNVNFVAGETVPNLVTVPLSATGGISVSPTLRGRLQLMLTSRVTTARQVPGSTTRSAPCVWPARPPPELRSLPTPRCPSP